LFASSLIKKGYWRGTDCNTEEYIRTLSQTIIHTRLHAKLCTCAN
jgi:hypothetical protein